MKRVIVIVVVAVGLLGGSAASRQAAGERVDAPAIAKIRDEALNRSQVMDTAFWLTDRYGPRLTGSPEFEEAGDWVMGRLRGWGAMNVHKERFSSGRGWSLVRFHATMTEPRVMPLIGVPQAWTPGVKGTVVADVIRPVITTAVDAARYRGALRGKIVLTQPPRDVRMLDHGDGTVLRYSDHDDKWMKEAMTPAPPPEPFSAGPPAVAAFDVEKFYRDEGVVALFDRGDDGDLAAGGSNLSWRQQRLDGGTLVVDGGAATDPADEVPRVRLAVEHYNRLVRLVDHRLPVKVDLQL